MNLNRLIAAVAVSVCVAVSVSLAVPIASAEGRTGAGVHPGIEASPKDDAPKAAAQKLKLKFRDSSEHQLSKEIFGTWKVDLDLTKRIDGDFGGCDVTKHIPAKSYETVRFVFSKDETAAGNYEATIKKILESFAELPPDMEEGKKAEVEERMEAMGSVWATGRYDFGSTTKGKGIFGLVSGMGTQHILLMPEGKDGTFNKIENAFIQLARDPKGDKDILWWGGEFPDDKFGALIRVMDEAKKDAPADGAKPAEDAAKPSDDDKKAKSGQMPDGSPAK